MIKVIVTVEVNEETTLAAVIQEALEVAQKLNTKIWVQFNVHADIVLPNVWICPDRTYQQIIDAIQMLYNITEDTVLKPLQFVSYDSGAAQEV